jgi:hypothetical protein
MLALPCICTCARTTWPPSAAPIAWCPRHTPRMGSLPAKWRIASTQIPASAGEQGPGESTSWSGRSAAISCTEISSLRNTRTS